MTRRRTFLDIAFTLAIFLSCPLQSADWAEWRGPNRDGISPESEWKGTSLDVRWKAQIGRGFATVSVAEGRVYAMGHSEGKDTVWCFDEARGKTLWRHDYASKLVDNLHEGGPAATPTIAGGRVYTLGKEGHVFCLDAKTGKPIWSQRPDKELGLRMPEWGFSSSILVSADQLLLDLGPLVALDMKDGSIAWKTKQYDAGYSSAVAFRSGSENRISVLNNNGLLIVRPDGQQVGLHPWKSAFKTSATTPIISGDKIFVSTGYKSGCTLVEWKDGKFKTIYKNKNMNNHMNACVLVDGHLYGFDGNSNRPRRLLNLVCLDFETGAVKWKQAGLGCGSLIAAGGRLILLGDRGDLVIAKATPEGYNELSRAKVLDGRCWTSPVLANGSIYCRDARGNLVCVDAKN